MDINSNLAQILQTKNRGDVCTQKVLANDKEKVMGDKKCDGDHKKHLCSLAGKKRIDEIRALVNDPQFICNKCGRVSDEQDRVCKPDKLKR